VIASKPSVAQVAVSKAVVTIRESLAPTGKASYAAPVATSVRPSGETARSLTLS
jgi:hypothetical protein